MMMIPHCLAILLVLQKASTTTSGQPPPAASECTGCSAQATPTVDVSHVSIPEGEPHGACGGQIAVALSLAGAEMFTLPKQTTVTNTANSDCSSVFLFAQGAQRAHQGDARRHSEYDCRKFLLRKFLSQCFAVGAR